uniref:ORF171 n=1 Tax=Cyanidiococcus yangmingshanensis TaxID=2690220 RepID=A0A7G5VUT3_9RHOD|nr:ORF171 [Cyanidiococcus yangmingshanensis]QMX77450.1 ORF171 [Cyanidiococcus yangmingshanensis]
MSLLIIGATGTLGTQLVREALSNGYEVKCMIRNWSKASFIKQLGAQLVYGDLRWPESMGNAFEGVTAVIDASVTRWQDLSQMTQIDWEGKLALLEYAKASQVKRYMFCSILNAHLYPQLLLMKYKADFETQLALSGLDYTICRFAGFYQALIPAYALPILDSRPLWLLLKPTRIAYIDATEAAQLMIRQLCSHDHDLNLMGPKAWSPNEIISLCEQLCGKKANVIRVDLKWLQSIEMILKWFQWTSPLAQQLSWSRILDEHFEPNEATLAQRSLEEYLQEYYSKVLSKLAHE